MLTVCRMDKFALLYRFESVILHPAAQRVTSKIIGHRKENTLQQRLIVFNKNLPQSIIVCNIVGNKAFPFEI